MKVVLLSLSIGCAVLTSPPVDRVDVTRLDGPNPAVSFHTIDRADPFAWDAILSLYEDYGAAMITSQNLPEGMSPSDWAQNVHTSWYPDGEALGIGLADRLLAPDAPAYVLIDELKSDTAAEVGDAAIYLRDHHPELAGRWGAYLVNGPSVSYAALQPALDTLLDADAVILPEMYVSRAEYCASGASAGSRDAWLAAFFAGDDQGFPSRFRYLNQRWTAVGSASHLSPVFGVTDSYMTGTGPSVFLDRMFYVWKTRSGFPSYTTAENGGPSAWKWDQPYLSNTSRDLAFRESFEHYALDGSTSSRLGQVTCP
ncbi:MAG: hypothetical protein ABMB14_26870 [Myxococcota bacterium]